MWDSSFGLNVSNWDTAGARNFLFLKKQTIAAFVVQLKVEDIRWKIYHLQTELDNKVKQTLVPNTT